MSESASAAFGGFEEKWLAANPEQATVALFLAADARLRASAFGCLVHELEQAVFGVREAHVAEAKIRWWRQELLAAASGEPRHPVSAVLFADPPAAGLDAAGWTALADGALEQRHSGTAADMESLLSGYAAMYLPMARVETALFSPSADAAAVARLRTLSHLLRALCDLPAAPERLPVPLDLLARHASTRAALAEPGAKRRELLRDFLLRLIAELHAALAAAPCAPLGRCVRARLDLALAQSALRADDPLLTLAVPPGSARWKTLWWSWREARRSARL